MDSRIALVLVVLATILLAEAAPFEKPDFYPQPLYNKHVSHWNKERRATSEDDVTFWVALKQRNLDVIDKLFEEITDPKSTQYTQYLTTQQIVEIVAPPKSVHDEVEHWLRSEGGIRSIESFGDAIKVTAAASSVEKLLNTRLHVYSSAKAKHLKTIKQVDGFTIPAHLADTHIEFISGLTQFPQVRKQKVGEPRVDQTQYAYSMPSTIRQQYNIPAGQKITNSKTTQGVVEFTPEYAPFLSDMTMYAQQINEPFSNVSIIVGPWDQSGAGESTLDVEMLYQIAPGAINYYWTVVNGWAYEMALELFGASNVPQVASVSYGWPEVYSCQSSITYAQCNGSSVQVYVQRANSELQKLALKGVSVLIATQDEGAPSEANEDCSLDTSTPVYAIYPSSSPYVTAVSATTIQFSSAPPPNSAPICQSPYNCASGHGTEVPCSVANTEFQWTTGGGFSAYAPVPKYQAKAVAAYLASNALIPPSKFFSSANRGYGDVSAVGDRILVVDGGSVSSSAGTSASTPIFSALVSLLNDRRLNQGKAPLGFLNKLLYTMAEEHPAAFYDVVTGDNRCTVGGVCCTYGFGATKGWDPVSGLGTPNFGEMVKYIDSLP